MKSDFYKKNISYLEFQRNVFFALSIILSFSICALSIFLFWKNERIIVTPPYIEKEFWVDNNHVSPTYLEQFGSFLGQLILSKSAKSSVSQRNVIMRHVDPSYSGILNKRLQEEEKVLHDENASYVFFPHDIRVNVSTLEVFLTGERTTYVSGHPLSTSKEGYRLQFSSRGARLLLNGIISEDL